MATTTPTIWAALAKANVIDEAPQGGFVGATNEQSRSKVVALPDGGYFLTWEDWSTVLTGFEPRDILGRLFNNAGAARGNELLASQNYNDLQQNSQSVAILSDGRIAIPHETDGAAAFGDLQNIDVTILNPDGVYLRHDDFRDGPGAGPFFNETEPAIAALADGKYVLIYANDEAGNKDLSAFIVTPGVDVNNNNQPIGIKGPEVIFENSADDASVPDAVTLTDGNFVVVYQSSANGGDIAFTVRSGTDASAVASGTVATGASAQTAPQVAALKGGGFVVVWNDAAGDGTGNAGVKAQIYTAAGATSGGVISLNTTTAGIQSEVAVTQLADGGFLAVWTNDDTNSVKGQRFNSAGTKIGVEFTAASLNDVSQPDLALMSDGRVVLSVTNDSAGNKDIYTVILDPREVVNGTNNAETLHSRKDGATINAFGGNDNLIGYNGADAMKGGTGRDTMTGGNGNDSYYVDVSGDRVIETNAASAGGRDTVYSTLSSTTLGANVEYLTLLTGALNGTGNTLANKITGNSAKNTLLGGSGNDTLTGGAGRDTMTGGSGADDFDFNSITETGKTSSTRDVIKDFVRGSDDIDLRDIDANGSAAGNTAFKFLSAKGAAFSGFKGELRWYQINSSNNALDKTIIEGDVNGDKRADFHIELTGLKTLSSGDFIL